MRKSPRDYAKLFESICQSFHLKQLKIDKCVYVKIVTIKGISRISMLKGAQWYVAKYDRCPLTGAVSANQELYINKILH